MFDHSGAIINEAGLSTAVQIIGWRDLPVSGDEFLEVENEKRAHMVMQFRQKKLGEIKSKEQQQISDEKLKVHNIVSHFQNNIFFMFFFLTISRFFF